MVHSISPVLSACELIFLELKVAETKWLPLSSDSHQFTLSLETPVTLKEPP